MKKIVVAFILIEILDVVTTIIGLRLGFQEANPIVRSMGWGIATVVKVAGTTMVAWGLLKAHKVFPRYCAILGAVIALETAYPVISNIILILER